MKIKLLTAYVLGALAAWTTPIENRQRSLLRSPDMLDVRTGANAFAGRTALSSGTAFVTISTQQVNSDSLVHATFYANATTTSGQAQPVVVSSIVSGVSFAVGNADGIGRAPGGTVMWEIRKTS